jgi:aspartyl-tRNA(Asn)/glutamyl-tRNA(Gln) amidotransferase subunit C
MATHNNVCYIHTHMTTDEVRALANLAHLAVAEDELARVAGEMDAILAYVAEVTTLADGGEVRDERPSLRNVMRDDVVTNTPGEYTERIVAQFPDKSGTSLRVKKIL